MDSSHSEQLMAANDAVQGVWSSCPFDIIHEIMLSMDTHSKENLRHLNQRWRHAALSMLGKRVFNCQSVFRAIAPLDQRGWVSQLSYQSCLFSNIKQYFRDVLVKDDWTTFATYAIYIRRLFVDPLQLRTPIIDEVLRSPYSTLPLLPKLENLALRFPQSLDSHRKPPFAVPWIF